MKKLAIVLCIALLGCKGPKGERGDKGAANENSFTTYTGLITSDDQIINNLDALDVNSTVSVYVKETGGTFVELPFFNPGVSVNIFYLASVHTVELVNVVSGIGTGIEYKIIVINKPSSAAKRLGL